MVFVRFGVRVLSCVSFGLWHADVGRHEQDRKRCARTEILHTPFRCRQTSRQRPHAPDPPHFNARTLSPECEGRFDSSTGRSPATYIGGASSVVAALSIAVPSREGGSANSGALPSPDCLCRRRRRRLWRPSFRAAACGDCLLVGGSVKGWTTAGGFYFGGGGNYRRACSAKRRSQVLVTAPPLPMFLRACRWSS